VQTVILRNNNFLSSDALVFDNVSVLTDVFVFIGVSKKKQNIFSASG